MLQCSAKLARAGVKAAIRALVQTKQPHQNSLSGAEPPSTP